VIEKRHGSAFQETALDARLRQAGITALVIAGMQTELCVDSACRAAVALGYRVTLAADGHTTWDSAILAAPQIIAHHNRTLADGYATVTAAEAITFPA
jgi:nicotinamidase-related amidase